MLIDDQALAIERDGDAVRIAQLRIHLQQLTFWGEVVDITSGSACDPVILGVT